MDGTGQPLRQVRTEGFGDPITDKSQVEQTIRRAQLAIRSPKTAPLEFLKPEGVMRLPEASFTANCVSIHISGPDVADLAFVDLPGEY